MGIGPELLEPYGTHVAKVSLDAVEALADRPRARYVVVTAVTPTPLGEGKTTTTVGLGQALACIGRQATIAIRQASMGPTFGIKGGAAGGGLQPGRPVREPEPAPDRRPARGDGRQQPPGRHGGQPPLQRQRARASTRTAITWKRVLDVNDRSLRNIVSGLGDQAGRHARGRPGSTSRRRRR